MIRLMIIALGFGMFLMPEWSRAEEPLHVRVDRHVAAGQVGPQAGLASDGEFIRRLYLDLIGRVPSSTEARTFLDDPSPDKRTQAVNNLLASPAYASNMAVVFDVMLMERRADKHVKAPEWRGYLRDAFAANKPWDKLAAEMMTADGNSTAIPRAAAKFILDRNAEPNLVTRDLGRKFFGMDLQCAQCHDHPNVADYYQRDYYGLFAFVSRSYVFQPDTKKPAVLAEKAAGEAKFKSVFTDISGATRPRIPAGLEIAEPVMASGEEWKVAPNPKDKKVRGIPKYSRRAQLAKHAAASSYFRRNIANRLWGHMMGRALVEPRDGIHSDNPAAHPALLDLLAEDLAAHQYDLNYFFRELALTQTYQRRFDLPGDLVAQVPVASLEADQKQKNAAVEKAQAAFDQALAKLDLARGERFTIQTELDKTLKPIADAQKARDTARNALAEAAKKLAPKKEAHQKLAAQLAEAQAAVEAAGEGEESKDLAAKAKDQQAQVDKSAAELKGLQQDHDKKAVALKTAADKLAAAEQSRTAAQAKWTQAHTAVQAADRVWQGAAVARETAKHAEALAFRRLEDAQAMADLQHRNQEWAAAQKKSDAAQTKEAGDAVQAATEHLSQRWTRNLAIGPFTHLTPEQLCWSMLEASGQTDAQRRAGESDYDKKNPLTEGAEPDDARLKARAEYAEQFAYDKLDRNTAPFAKLFGGAAGEVQTDFYATADQALYFANGDTVRSWLGRLASRLNAMKDSKLLAEELYLSVLTRRPDPAEIAAVEQYLAVPADKRTEAIREMAWGLMTSTEFRFKH